MSLFNDFSCTFLCLFVTKHKLSLCHLDQFSLQIRLVLFILSRYIVIVGGAEHHRSCKGLGSTSNLEVRWFGKFVDFDDRLPSHIQRRWNLILHLDILMIVF